MYKLQSCLISRWYDALVVKCKDEDLVKCEVVDGSELKIRRHLNVRGESATLQSITEKDWDDIKFGVDNKIDIYAVSLVKDAEVMHELKAYLKILCCSFMAMVSRGDLGAELPVDEVPSLQYHMKTLFGCVVVWEKLLYYSFWRNRRWEALYHALPMDHITGSKLHNKLEGEIN
ncbi:hypothetical protein ACET3Z_031531 [Daucus carota]